MNIPFDDLLRTFPLDPNQQGVHIQVPQENGTRKPVYLKNPVLVATWVDARGQGITPSSPNPFQDYAMFQEYTANAADGNLWFATVCNARTLIRDMLHIDLSCMNPALGTDACNLAITLGLPSVGVPYSFSPMADPNGGQWNPYTETTTWWQQDLMIALCDRSALIRPSLNPTVAPDSPKRPTADGRPLSNGQTYRRPVEGDEIYPAVMEKLNGSKDDIYGPKEFVGWINACAPIDEFEPLPPMEFRGADGFWQWLEYWTANSWYGPHEPSQTELPSSDNKCLIQGTAPYNLFPFSGIGLSLNWNLELEGVDPPPAEFYSVSEFIQVGEQPIYVVGVYQGAQVLGGGLPGSGQVPWYESCNSDFNMDGTVDAMDLTILLAQWNTDPATPQDPPNMCLNRDKLAAAVGPAALMEFLEDWGPCPGWPLKELDPACN